MKIGLFTDFYAPHTGGVESAVASHAAALRARGHEVTVVCPENRHQPKPFKGEVRLKSIHHKHFIKDHPGVLPSKANQATVDALDFDVVHIHSEHAIAFLGVWYAQRHKVPAFETKHTDNVAWIRQNHGGVVRMRAGAFAVDHWTRRLMKHLGLKKRPRYHFTSEPTYEKHSWRHMLLLTPYMKATLAPSQYILDKARLHYPAGHYLLLQNGIDTSRFVPGFGEPDDPVRILWVARASAEKRPLEFLHAVKLLAAKTKTAFEVDLIGSGNQDAEIARYIAKHRLTNVHVHGSLLREEVLPYFNRADVFAFTSYHFDTQGLVVAESLSAGAAVMLCDERILPPGADTISDGIRLSASPSAKDMAAALAIMMRKKTPDSAARLKHFADETYSLAILGERLEAIYSGQITA